MNHKFTMDTPVQRVIHDPAFGSFGRLLFPVNTGCWSGATLGSLKLTWYNHIDPSKTVEIVNMLKERSLAGETVFYNIYTDKEKTADPAKKNTGLFFFRGKPGAPFAICNAGGAFAYVAAIHDSFPHALELSKRGYNAFALIYRPNAQSACEDLARGISFIFHHAAKLKVDTRCYSLWGGSAGARMAAWLGTYGPAAFGGGHLLRPGTVVMQYTSLDEYSPGDPPAFICVGDSDWIAPWRLMKARVDAMSACGVDTEFHCYPGLSHGFGLGTGTAAEGWLDLAARFWERQIKNQKQNLKQKIEKSRSDKQ